MRLLALAVGLAVVWGNGAQAAGGLTTRARHELSVAPASRPAALPTPATVVATDPKDVAENPLAPVDLGIEVSSFQPRGVVSLRSISSYDLGQIPALMLYGVYLKGSLWDGSAGRALWSLRTSYAQQEVDHPLLAANAVDRARLQVLSLSSGIGAERRVFHRVYAGGGIEAAWYQLNQGSTSARARFNASSFVLTGEAQVRWVIVPPVSVRVAYRQLWDQDVGGGDFIQRQLLFGLQVETRL